MILGLPFVSHMLGSSDGSATSLWASPTKFFMIHCPQQQTAFQTINETLIELEQEDKDQTVKQLLAHAHDDLDISCSGSRV